LHARKCLHRLAIDSITGGVDASAFSAAEDDKEHAGFLNRLWTELQFPDKDGGMSINTFGRMLRFTSWGESHGPALGAVVDGCPPGLALSETDIQPYLDARRPGQSKYTTQRQELDAVRILSGVFEGLTTGTPISLMIENVDQRSKDYSEVAKAYRPGHADYAYDAKYGLRDYRGGGRSSARETAARVAAGGVARLVIPEVSILAYVTEIGGDRIDNTSFDESEITRNPFFCPDPTAALRWEKIVDQARLAGSSVGAVVECIATGVPAGWGAPLYAKLDADLAGAMMSINAVKGVEIGDGFAAARLTGEQNADRMRPKPGGGNLGPDFLANHSGGVAGGISTGQPVVVRVAFKPTSSILTPVETITRSGEAAHIQTKGRHDPCVGIRGTPVVEAMMALVLADHKLVHRGQCG
jgi:chorismate synthase